LCRIAYPSDLDVEWECRWLRAGETLEGLFGDWWVHVARYNRIDRRHARPGVAIKVPLRFDAIGDFTPLPLAYPPAARDGKFILVDLTEQFLGAYEYGRLVLSAPVATGEEGNETPGGDFRITAADPRHRSSRYVVEGTDLPYPMHHGLRFHVNRAGVAYWIHGRDMPGYPASHGCIGLYDEPMQQEYYGEPPTPVLDDARRLYEWALGPRAAIDAFQVLGDGPRMRIVGQAPAGP
jgi:hypothetical protein